MSKRLDYNQIAPAGMKAFGSVYGYIMQSSLPDVLVDLVYLRVSQINNCAYCLDSHTRDLIKKGVKIEKLALVQAWAEAATLFDARERAALAWAETVTRVAETNVPDEAYQAARAVFEERELVDLTIAISLMNAYNRMAISFRNTPQAAIEKKTRAQPNRFTRSPERHTEGDNMKLVSAAALALIGCLVGFNSANAQGAAMKTTPTTKILAIGTINPGFEQSQVFAVLPEEVRETVDLYLDGK